MHPSLRKALDLFLKWLRNPQLQLAVNGGLMVFTGLMALGQWTHGDPEIASVLTVSTFSYISAIVFWVVIWITTPKTTPSTTVPEEHEDLLEEDSDNKRPRPWKNIPPPPPKPVNKPNP